MSCVVVVVRDVCLVSNVYVSAGWVCVVCLVCVLNMRMCDVRHTFIRNITRDKLISRKMNQQCFAPVKVSLLR